ncbi:hypothetical protein JQX08_11905 [Pseudomonas sp. UL073]|uniref:Uncharacterized protein n=1 Tax=Zestomonas insulae TaxID=2809017 RepID=A0ABS2IGE8_9GAMM|nr:hypothetical protein [Pseudomonas insulae]MBM7061409.1 hypothetical protein [Pseudomonas insulae]
MGELRRIEVEGGLYERLLQRLALALDEADTALRLRDESSGELELRGLSSAEVAFIHAYLDHDLNWLSGWHAAAEELELIERRRLRPPKAPLRNGARPVLKPLGAAKPLLKRRRQLCCALCGTPANWQAGSGVQGCDVCGSQLFRASKPR